MNFHGNWMARAGIVVVCGLAIAQREGIPNDLKVGTIEAKRLVIRSQGGGPAIAMGQNDGAVFVSLTDGGGTVRAQMILDREGDGQIWVCDRGKSTKASLNANQVQASIELSSEGESGSLWVSAEGQSALMFSAPPERSAAPPIIAGSDGRPIQGAIVAGSPRLILGSKGELAGLRVIGSHGSSMILQLDAMGQPRLELRDNQGRALFEAP